MEIKEALVKFLKDISYTFALSHKEMPRINSDVMVHRLNVDHSFRPSKQNMLAFNPERYKVIKKKGGETFKGRIYQESVVSHLFG